MGGACVLDDCVPSKTFIASAGIRVELHRAPELGVQVDRRRRGRPPAVNSRVKGLALAQSADVRARLEREGIRIIRGTARFARRRRPAAAPIEVATADGGTEELPADVVLIATGANPRVLDGAGRTANGS